MTRLVYIWNWGERTQIIQLKLCPSGDPVAFLSSAYWAAPTEKKHLTALTVNEANFVFFIKAEAEDDQIDNRQQRVFPNLLS